MNPVMNKTKAGFTLLELLTVVAIIGLLAAMIFPTLGKVKIRARRSKAITELNTIKLALIEYYSEYSGFPTNDASPVKGGLYKLFEEDYLDTALADAFKSSQPYTYYSCIDDVPTADSCIVFSVGTNGKEDPSYKDATIDDFDEAIRDAFPGLATGDFDQMPTSDNIYLFMTNASRNDPLAIREGEIRYKE
ncbi:MAG: prepilin-type N-terminal cleavage/methylation domain-containing protein [Candidatus Omnitrophica bacterium]|nr:prepilin-type N-terminal cleavage/methylation domain-containing protein [Candidatus Omnitrophota bacterium]